MKKTSRRSFGKQLAGAMAALPIVSSAIEAQQRPEKNKTDAQKAQAKIREHDTPPPVLIGEGSLTVETTMPFGGAVGVGGGVPRHKHFVSAYSALSLAHIKIVDGSGEMLYRNDRPGNSEVRILVHDGTEVRIGRAGQGFYIELDDDKALGNSQDLRPRKRQHGYRPKKTNNDLDIEAITVAASPAANAPFLYKVTKYDLNSELKESRVMIWLE